MGKGNKTKFRTDRKPLVSVVITTKNEALVIERLLKSVLLQTYGNIEIIIVDNGSSDATKEIAEKYTERVFDKGPERSAQRNYGVSKSKGRYVLILDADMELTPNVVEECVKAVSEGKRVGSVVIPEESVASNYWEEVKAFERSFYNEKGDETTDAARFFPKRIFDRFGGYDETITGPEDWDLPETIRKNGYLQKRIKAKIYHRERIPNPFALARKKYYYALNSHKYLRKQNISALSSKTLYFLRPVFYRKWWKILSHPLLSAGMFFLLSLELVYGGIGFMKGKFFER